MFSTSACARRCSRMRGAAPSRSRVSAEEGCGCDRSTAATGASHDAPRRPHRGRAPRRMAARAGARSWASIGRGAKPQGTGAGRSTTPTSTPAPRGPRRSRPRAARCRVVGGALAVRRLLVVVVGERVELVAAEDRVDGHAELFEVIGGAGDAMVDENVHDARPAAASTAPPPQSRSSGRTWRTRASVSSTRCRHTWPNCCTSVQRARHVMRRREPHASRPPAAPNPWSLPCCAGSSCSPPRILPPPGRRRRRRPGRRVARRRRDRRRQRTRAHGDDKWANIIGNWPCRATGSVRLRVEPLERAQRSAALACAAVEQRRVGHRVRRSVVLRDASERVSPPPSLAATASAAARARRAAAAARGPPAASPPSRESAAGTAPTPKRGAIEQPRSRWGCAQRPALEPFLGRPRVDRDARHVRGRAPVGPRRAIRRRGRAVAPVSAAAVAAVAEPASAPTTRRHLAR